MGVIVKSKDGVVLTPQNGGWRPGAGRPFARGTRLADMIAERRLRKHEVTHHLGISDKALYNYLTGRRPIPSWLITPLCDLLECDPEDIFTTEGADDADDD